MPACFSRCASSRIPPGAIKVRSNEAAAGLEIGEQRGARADAVEVVDGELDAGFARDGQQVQHGVGRAAARGHAGNGVLQRVAGEDRARTQIAPHQLHDLHARLKPNIIFLGIGCRNAGAVHRRDAQELGGRGHGVGGELATASPSTGTGVVFNIGEFGVGHAPAGVSAHGFEHVLNGDVVPLEAPRLD